MSWQSPSDGKSHSSGPAVQAESSPDENHTKDSPPNRQRIVNDSRAGHGPAAVAWAGGHTREAWGPDNRFESQPDENRSEPNEKDRDAPGTPCTIHAEPPIIPEWHSPDANEEGELSLSGQQDEPRQFPTHAGAETRVGDGPRRSRFPTRFGGVPLSPKELLAYGSSAQGRIRSSPWDRPKFLVALVCEPAVPFPSTPAPPRAGTLPFEIIERVEMQPRPLGKTEKLRKGSVGIGKLLGD